MTTLRGETSKTAQSINVIIALAFIVATMIVGYRSIGLPPVIIVGGSGIVGLIMWYRTYLRRPLDPHIILPPFLLTVSLAPPAATTFPGCTQRRCR